MRSQWYELKSKAISYRKKGYSLRMVEQKLKIPRSTLSGWFRDVVLTVPQKTKLLNNWKLALVNARVEAVKWHNHQKQLRLTAARQSALESLGKVDLKQKEIIDIALAMLYLGEGTKSSVGLGLGNSNPMILKFYLRCLQIIYKLDISKVRCDLHLRADQNPSKLKRYWSGELGIPLENFKGAAIDMRTKGRPTYKSYKGVCVIFCGNAAIQRKLIYLAEEFCKKVIDS